MSLPETGKTEATQIFPSEQSVIQTWERQQDVHVAHPHLDMLDAWSSDGGSISSSSSCCSDTHCINSDDPMESTNCGELTVEDRINSTKDMRRPMLAQNRNLHYLKCAGVYTSKEVVDQAIDRWESYKSLCYQGLSVLRQQLVDAYIPHAMEENKVCSAKQVSKGSGVISNLSARSQLRQRAAKNILRHSVKTANQRHLSCVSKFAIVSNRIAKWRKPTASQQCRFRDPTTTTWEKRCTNQCVPLLPVCSYHLVQMRPAPDYDLNSSDIYKNLSNEMNAEGSIPKAIPKSEELVPDYSVNAKTNTKSDAEQTSLPAQSVSGDRSRHSSCGDLSTCTLNKTIKFDDHIKSQSSRINRSGKGHFDQSSTVTPNSPILQMPSQYLFRCCRGGSFNNCTEPVIAWTPFTRCIHHSTMVSVCAGSSDTTQSNYLETDIENDDKQIKYLT